MKFVAWEDPATSRKCRVNEDGDLFQEMTDDLDKPYWRRVSISRDDALEADAEDLQLLARKVFDLGIPKSTHG